MITLPEARARLCDRIARNLDDDLLCQLLVLFDQLDVRADQADQARVKAESESAVLTKRLDDLAQAGRQAALLREFAPDVGPRPWVPADVEQRDLALARAKAAEIARSNAEAERDAFSKRIDELEALLRNPVRAAPTVPVWHDRPRFEQTAIDRIRAEADAAADRDAQAIAELRDPHLDRVLAGGPGLSIDSPRP